MAAVHVKKKPARKQRGASIARTDTFDVDRWIDDDPRTPDSMVAGISPDAGERLLARNTKNRPIGKTKLSIYAQNMIDGVFPLTSSAIAFDWDGALNNGQHRLMAVVESGMTVKFLVAKGLDPISFLYEDIHIRRSLADMLAILKEPNYKVLASALAFVSRYFNSVKAVEGELKLRNTPSLDSKHRMHTTLIVNTVAPQIHEALDLLGEHPEIRESAAIYASKGNSLVSPGMQAALHYLGSRIDRARTERFLEVIQTGASQEVDAPEIHLVRLLHAASVSRRTVMQVEKKFMYCIKALREALAGRPMKQLRLSPRIVRVTESGERVVKAEEIPLLEDLIDGRDRTLPVTLLDDTAPLPTDPSPDDIRRAAEEIRQGQAPSRN
jgi:hypothetical protein